MVKVIQILKYYYGVLNGLSWSLFCTILLFTTNSLASLPRMVIVMQRHSQFGLEQISLVQDANLGIKVISNSGALEKGFPQKLGMMKISKKNNLDKRINNLVNKEKSKELSFKKIIHSHSSFEVLFNGREIDSSSKDFETMKELLVDAVKIAHITKGAEIKTIGQLKCFDQFYSEKICESQFGWVYPVK